MLKAIAALKSFNQPKIWKISSPVWETNGISLLFIQQQHAFCLIIHFDKKSEICQQQNVAELIHFVCLALNSTEGSTLFAIEVRLNKNYFQTKLIFCFQAIERIMWFIMSRNQSIRCWNWAWPNFGLRSFPSIIYLFLRRKGQTN